MAIKTFGCIKPFALVAKKEFCKYLMYVYDLNFMPIID